MQYVVALGCPKLAILLQKLFQPIVLFQVYMLSLAFADIDCLFSPNQGITLPIKKEELKYTWEFFIFLHSTKYLEVFYSFTEDKRHKKVFLKPKIASHCWWLSCGLLLGSFGHELDKIKEMLFLCLFLFKSSNAFLSYHSNFLLIFW